MDAREPILPGNPTVKRATVTRPPLGSVLRSSDAFKFAMAPGALGEPCHTGGTLGFEDAGAVVPFPLERGGLCQPILQIDRAPIGPQG